MPRDGRSRAALLAPVLAATGALATACGGAGAPRATAPDPAPVDVASQCVTPERPEAAATLTPPADPYALASFPVRWATTGGVQARSRTRLFDTTPNGRHARARAMDTGEEVWRTRVAPESCERCRAELELVGETLLLAEHEQGVAVLDAETGEVRWRRPAGWTAHPWEGDVLLRKGCTFVRARPDGTEAWTATVELEGCRVRAVDDRAAYVAPCTRRRGGVSRVPPARVQCEAEGARLDRDTGRVAPWLVEAGHPVGRVPGYVLVRRDGELVAWNVQQEWRQWTRPIPERARVMVTEDAVVVHTRQSVRRLGPADGEPIGPPLRLADDAGPAHLRAIVRFDDQRRGYSFEIETSGLDPVPFLLVVGGCGAPAWYVTPGRCFARSRDGRLLCRGYGPEPQVVALDPERPSPPAAPQDATAHATAALRALRQTHPLSADYRHARRFLALGPPARYAPALAELDADALLADEALRALLARALGAAAKQQDAAWHEPIARLARRALERAPLGELPAALLAVEHPAVLDAVRARLADPPERPSRDAIAGMLELVRRFADRLPPETLTAVGRAALGWLERAPPQAWHLARASGRRRAAHRRIDTLLRRDEPEPELRNAQRLLASARLLAEVVRHAHRRRAAAELLDALEPALRRLGPAPICATGRPPRTMPLPEGWQPSCDPSTPPPTAAQLDEGTPQAIAVWQSEVLGAPELWLMRRDGDGWTFPAPTGIVGDRFWGIEALAREGGTLRVTLRHHRDEAREPRTERIAIRRVLADRDDDGWTDRLERRVGTSPRRADTDGDGAADPADPMPRCPRDRGQSPEGAAVLLFAEGLGVHGEPTTVVDRSLGRRRCSEVPTLGGPIVVTSPRASPRRPAPRWTLDLERQARAAPGEPLELPELRGEPEPQWPLDPEDGEDADVIEEAERAVWTTLLRWRTEQEQGEGGWRWYVTVREPPNGRWWVWSEP